MKIGDSFRVSERKYRKQDICKVSVGKIDLITPGGITILKKNGIRETFNIGDLINEGQRKELNETGEWELIKFKQEGGKIALYKVTRRDN